MSLSEDEELSLLLDQSDDDLLLDSLRLQQPVTKDRLLVLASRLKQDVANFEEADFWAWIRSSKTKSTLRTTSPTSKTDIEVPKIPAALQTDHGKRHLDIVTKILHVSSSQAVELTYLTLRHLLATTAATTEEESSQQSEFLRGLLGTQLLISRCISVYHSQKIARIQCLTEILRIESSEEESNTNKDLLPLCKDILDLLNPNWLFQMILVRLVDVFPSTSWEDVEPVSHLRYLQPNETETAEISSQIALEIYQSVCSQYVNERTYLLDCLLSLLYQKFIPKRQDYFALVKAFATVQFFVATNDKRSSFLVGLICMEAMGLWKATQPKEPPVQEGVTKTPRRGRSRPKASSITTIANKGTSSSSWIQSHSLLSGDNTEEIQFELEEICSMLVLSVSNSQQTEDTTYPQSVALLSFGLLLRIASFEMEYLSSLAVYCVQQSNDTLGAFDYLEEMMQNLLLVSGEETNGNQIVVAYASIFAEVISALILGFYSSSSTVMPRKDIISKYSDVQFICHATCTIYSEKPSLCVLFWKDFFNETKSSARMILLQTTYLLAEEGVAIYYENKQQLQHHLYDFSLLISYVSPFVTLISSLCYPKTEFLQYAVDSMLLPQDWCCILLEAVTNYYYTMEIRKQRQQAISNEVRKWIEHSLEALKKVAFMSPSFVRKSLVHDSSSISHRVQQIYRISVSDGSNAAIQSTLLLSYLCTKKRGNDDEDICDNSNDESAQQWTIEVMKLLMKNHQAAFIGTSATNNNSFGVYTDALLSAESSANTSVYYYYTSILNLIEALASQLQSGVLFLFAQSKNQPYSRVPIETEKVNLALYYIQITWDGFLCARSILLHVLKSDNNNDMKSCLKVSHAALTSIERTLKALNDIIWNTNEPQTLQAASHVLHEIVCELSVSIASAVGMFSTLPVLLGWFEAMRQCYDSLQLKNLMSNSKERSRKFFFGEGSTNEQSLDALLEAFADDLRCDLGRIHVNSDYQCFILGDLIWTTGNAALALLHTWASTATNTTFLLYIKRHKNGSSKDCSSVPAPTERKNEMTPSCLLRCSVIEDSTRSFLYRLLTETDETMFIHNRSSQPNNSAARDACLNNTLVLRYKSMLPREVSCISLITRLIETDASIDGNIERKIRKDEAVTLQVFDLLQICLPQIAVSCAVSNTDVLKAPSVLTYHALHGGCYLHRILSSAFEALKLEDDESANRKVIVKLINFATNAIDSNEISLCSAILFGLGRQDDDSRQKKVQRNVDKTLNFMLDALMAVLKDDNQHVEQLSLACAIASCIASIWGRIRSTIRIGGCYVEEKDPLNSPSLDLLERLVSLLLLNSDFFGLLLKLIFQTANNMKHSLSDGYQLEVSSLSQEIQPDDVSMISLELNVVASCISIITAELHLSGAKSADEYNSLPSEVKKNLFSENASSVSCNLHRLTYFFTFTSSVLTNYGLEISASSTWNSFLQVYFSFILRKEASDKQKATFSSLGFFPYSQTGDIVLLLATAMHSWGNLSIEKLSTSSESKTESSIEALLENSAAVAEVLVTVLSFCTGSKNKTYLANLEAVSEKILHLIQLTSSQLFPLTAPVFTGSLHDNGRKDMIGYKLRLRLSTIVLIIAQFRHKTWSDRPLWSEKEKAIETRLCLVDLICDTLNHLNHARLEREEERLEVCFTCNFSNKVASNELLTMCVAALTALLPSDFYAHGGMPEYIKKLFVTLTKNKCLDVMTHHLISVSQKAYSFIHGDGNPHAKPEFTSQYHDAIQIISNIVKFVCQLITVASLCPEVQDIDILGSSGVIRAITSNLLIETCCKKWHSWSYRKDADMSDFRGYIPLQDPSHMKSIQRNESTFRSPNKDAIIKPRIMSVSVKVARDDEAHHVWIRVLQMMTSLARMSRKRDFSGRSPYHPVSAELVLDFISCYDYVILSAIQSLGKKESSFSKCHSVSKFTRNALAEARGCLSFVAELCCHDEGRPPLLQRVCPELFQAFIDASLSALQQLASFLGSAASARDLFDLVGQFRALESGNVQRNRRRGVRAKSPTSDQRAAVQLLCLHPLLANGVPNARHDAITNSHYVSSKCACMTERDCQLNSLGIASPLKSNFGSPGSPSVDSFQLHVNNAFTAQIEELAAGTIYNAITVLLRAHPSSTSFIPFNSMELSPVEAARLVKEGAIIAVRPSEERSGLLMDFRGGSLSRQEEVYRYAKVVACNEIDHEWLVEYFEPTEFNPPARSREKISFSCLGGVIDMDKMKTMLAFEPPNLKAVVERKVESKPSIGHLMLVLQWCNQQIKGGSRTFSDEFMTSFMMESLAGRAAQLLLKEIDLVEKLGIQASEKDVAEINTQLLHIFGGDIYNANTFGPANEEVMPLATLLGPELWDAIQAHLKHRLECARRDLNAAWAKLVGSPVKF